MRPDLPLDPRLETERLVLRPPTDADLAAIVERIGDPAVCRMLARVPHPYAMADAVAWLERCRWQLAEGSDVPLVIEEGGAVIGGIGLHGLPGTATLGYWLARPAWGRGLASEAVRALLAYAFDWLGLSAIVSGVFIDNPASLRVQEKLGFERTGHHEVFCLARGHAVDHIDTILTHERYRALNP